MVDDSRNRRRRWTQFGLGTVFLVVTVVALFVGYEVNWIRQRHDVIDRAKASQAWRFKSMTENEYIQPPGLLWLFREPGYALVVLDGGLIEDRPVNMKERAEILRVTKLFPEADVWIDGRP